MSTARTDDEPFAAQTAEHDSFVRRLRLDAEQQWSFDGATEWNPPTTGGENSSHLSRDASSNLALAPAASGANSTTSPRSHSNHASSLHPPHWSTILHPQAHERPPSPPQHFVESLRHQQTRAQPSVSIGSTYQGPQPPSTAASAFTEALRRSGSSSRPQPLQREREPANASHYSFTSSNFPPRPEASSSHLFVPPTPRSPSHRTEDTFDGLDIDDWLSDDAADDWLNDADADADDWLDDAENDDDEWLNGDNDADIMPPRRARLTAPGSTIDLTAENTLPPIPTPEPRPRPHRRPHQPPSTTVVISDSDDETLSAPPQARARIRSDIERLDLTSHDPDAAAANASLAQTIAAQQASASASTSQTDAQNGGGGPLRIGQRSCIICMEHYTDMTTTHCGHVFCHECLTQALMAGEKRHHGHHQAGRSAAGMGNCPVCRKPVSREKANHVIPMKFMKRSQFVPRWWLKEGALEARSTGRKETKRKRVGT